MKTGRDTFSRTLKEELSRVEITGASQAFWEDYAIRSLLEGEGWMPQNPTQAEQNRASPKRQALTPGTRARPYLLRRLFYLRKKLSGTEPALSGVETASKAGLDDPRNRRSYLRGIFLVRGSLISPVRGHHLEIALPTQEQASLVRKLIAGEGLKSGMVKRRSAWVVYLKDADDISQFLALLGATRSVLRYEEIRLQKTVKSSVLRQMNMYKANLSRSFESSVKQIEDILLLDEEIGLKRLPRALREIAEARLNNPELTMEELGQTLNPPISKSAVNHRIRRIAQKAESLRYKYKREQ